MATFGALRGVRFGHRERELLLMAAPPGSREHPGVITGMTRITGSTRSEKQSLFRAARRLETLGLAVYAQQRFAERSVCIELTDLGAAVVERFKRELTEGRRIRWPTEEE